MQVSVLTRARDRGHAELRRAHGSPQTRRWRRRSLLERQTDHAYARDRTVRQAHLTSANPDLVHHPVRRRGDVTAAPLSAPLGSGRAMTPGTITCYGCTALDYGYGFGCTAQLTQTHYHVRGEIAPRAADPAASLALFPVSGAASGYSTPRRTSTRAANCVCCRVVRPAVTTPGISTSRAVVPGALCER